MNVIIFFFNSFIEKSILVRMKLQIDDNSPGPLASLDKWRKKKYEDIDREYDRRVRSVKQQIAKHNEQITQTSSAIQELLQEGDVSIDQVQEMRKKIDLLTEQIERFLRNDLVGQNLNLGGIQYLIKGRIQCRNADLYILESEKALVGYTGLCPMCDIAHVPCEPNRGMYVLAKTLQTEFFEKK